MKAQAGSVETGSRTSKDADLVDGCRRRDRGAQIAFIRRWEGPLLQIAYRVVGSLDQAEDIRQVILLRILRSPETLPEPGSLAAWLRRCVVNESVARVRRAIVHDRATSAIRQSGAPEQAVPPLEQLVASEEIGRLHHALQRLEAESRALLSLRYDEDLTYREISEAVQRPVSTVKSQVRRAINELRQILERSEQERGRK